MLSECFLCRWRAEAAAPHATPPCVDSVLVSAPGVYFLCLISCISNNGEGIVAKVHTAQSLQNRLRLIEWFLAIICIKSNTRARWCLLSDSA